MMVESNINADEEHKFSVSLLAFWIKGCIYADNSFVHVDMPNTILLGMVPAGKNRKNIPLQSVSNAQDSNWYKVGNMVFGAILALAGLYMMKETVLGGLLLALIGILLFLTGFKFRLSIERNSGVTENYDVPFFDGDKVRKLVEEINQSVSSFQDQSNYRDYGRSNTQAMIDAIQQSQAGVMPNQQYQPNMQPQMNDNMQQMPNQGMAQDVQSESQQTVNTDIETQSIEAEQATDVQSSPVMPNAAVSNQFCPQCGAQNTADASFCTNCGNQLQ